MASGMQSPDVVDTRRIKLDDLSVEEDSGWREWDEERVSQLADAFMTGDFGATTLAIPSVLADSERVLRTSQVDGRTRLNNGKSTVGALKRLAAEWQKTSKPADGGLNPPAAGGGLTPPAADGGLTPPATGLEQEALEGWPPTMVGGLTPPSWAQGKLLEVFQQGLRVDVVVYSIDDNALVVAINGLQHDGEQNRFVPTSINTKVRIVMTQHDRVPGGDWGKTSQALLAMYGQSKRRTVARWVAAARDLHPEVLQLLQKTGVKKLPQSYVFDNKYMLGRGEEARFKLTPLYGQRALELVAERIASGTTVAVFAFVNEYCAVMKAIENWERQQVKAFGIAATGYPAFSRVLQMLRTEPNSHAVASHHEHCRHCRHHRSACILVMVCVCLGVGGGGGWPLRSRAASGRCCA